MTFTWGQFQKIYHQSPKLASHVPIKYFIQISEGLMSNCTPYLSGLKLTISFPFCCHRQLSRHLVGLWVTGHPTAMALLKRIMPSGLLAYLDSDAEVPEDDMDRLHIRDNLKLAQVGSRLWYHYNAVNFLLNSHNRHLILRLWGWGMGCLLCVWSLIYVLPLLSQWWW